MQLIKKLLEKKDKKLKCNSLNLTGIIEIKNKNFD